MGPRAVMDILEKRNFVIPAGIRTMGCPSYSPGTIPTMVAWVLMYICSLTSHTEVIFPKLWFRFKV